jgi:dethiobiotin synthetase
MSSVFITGTGTDVGKTLVMTALCWQLRQLGKKITAIKPVMSGFDPKDPKSDAALILKSCGLVPTQELMKAITPWQFRAALSPHRAAAREGKTLAFDEVVKFCKDHTGLNSDVVLAEGAGGLMSPLSNDRTMLDCMSELQWPVVLVAGNYLGCISHTLTAIEVLRSRKLPIRALVISASEKNSIPLDDTAETIKKFIPADIPVVRVPRVQQAEELWKYMPPISWIVE